MTPRCLNVFRLLKATHVFVIFLAKSFGVDKVLKKEMMN